MTEPEAARCWLRCTKCGTKELLVRGTKFDGGCLNCGGGPRVAENDHGRPMVVWSNVSDPTSWDESDYDETSPLPTPTIKEREEKWEWT